MKARIINGYEFGGIHQDEWINNNLSIELGGVLVSDWVLTELLPTGVVKPIWDGEEWVETQTLNDINEVKKQQAILIDLEYTERITLLLAKHIQKKIIDGLDIPLNIIEERDALRLECNNKILALGISDFTYRINVRGL